MSAEAISHYRIIRKLGEGGMGEVYLAEDTRLGRKVALKLLPRNLTGDDQRVRRFRQEACAASTLNHPNILTIYDIGEVDGTHFIAAEYVKGDTLRGRMIHGPLGWRESLELIAQAANALAAAHEVGVVHRDIKPENLMIRPDGYLKVLDFGLAKLTQRRPPSSSTHSEVKPLISTEPGLLMGTPQYMSPEQVRGFDVDQRSDIFSLGVVLYEMLTGIAPFRRRTMGDVIAAILHSEPLPVRHYNPEVPALLQQVVTKALNKDVNLRYQSVSELSSEIIRLKQSQQLIPEHHPATLPLWGGKGIKNIVNSILTGPQAVTSTVKKVTGQSDQARINPGMGAGKRADGDKLFRNRMGWLATALTIAVVSIGGVLYVSSRRADPGQALSPPDSPVSNSAIATVTAWPDAAKRYALLIGVNTYTKESSISGEWPEIRNDASGMKAALVQYAGFPEKQATVLFSEKPEDLQVSRSNILGSVARLAENMPKDGLLLVYFAGIGFHTDDQISLLPSDARGMDEIVTEQTAINLSTLIERIRKAGISQVIIILDIGLTGLNQAAEANASAESIAQAYKNEFRVGDAGSNVKAFAVLHSVGLGEPGMSSDKINHGYFTWELIEGLKGGAANQGGNITLKGLLDYVQQRVPMRVLLDSGKKQTPWSVVEGYIADEVLINRPKK
ncbi:MAG TPA: protein kinase [Blastocatellia bacterium]|nr:protein kinase [Blastocatellia bacterium]